MYILENILKKRYNLINKTTKGGSSMLKYEIEGGSLPVVICYPEQGQALCTEGGSMSWMSPNMKMETNSGGGIKKAIGRLFAGESLFLNEFTSVSGTGMIAFSSSFPGNIIPYEVTPGNGIVVQRKGFLAMEKGLDVSVFFQHKFGVGLFGGEGLFNSVLTGPGRIWLQTMPICNVAASIRPYIPTGNN